MYIKKFNLLYICSLLVIGFLAGCSIEDVETDRPTNSLKGMVGSSYYIINPATTFQNIEGVNAIVFKANTIAGTESVAGFVIENNTTVSTSDINSSALTTTTELRNIIASIGAESFLSELSTINEQVFTKYTEFTVGDYSFKTPVATTTVDIRNLMLDMLGNNTSTTLATGTGVLATEFRMFVTVVSFNHNYYYIVSISPKESSIFENNFALMTALSSGTNFTGTNERLSSTINKYAANANTSNQADFLFVVDDSGSMYDQQIALAAATSDFENAINFADMNYTIALITTGDGANDISCTENCYDRVVKDVGIISDMSTFKTQVTSLEVNGSYIETGIYNSEQALLSTTKGDTKDGLLAPLGFPRLNTQLSVVVLSDEESQYESRAGTSFNVNNNLFTRDNILFSSIIDTGLCGDGQEKTGQYDDLSIATGGLVGNICNGGANPNFSAIMQNIVFQAAGAYKLTNKYAKPNSISVKLNGVSMSQSIKDGYMYIEGTNSIAFFGTMPDAGSKIEVYYEYPKDIKLFAND